MYQDKVQVGALSLPDCITCSPLDHLPASLPPTSVLFHPLFLFLSPFSINMLFTIEVAFIMEANGLFQAKAIYVRSRFPKHIIVSK